MFRLQRNTQANDEENGIYYTCIYVKKINSLVNKLIALQVKKKVVGDKSNPPLFHSDNGSIPYSITTLFLAHGEKVVL